MDISNRVLFGIMTVLLSGIILFFGQGPLHMDIITTVLVITLATFIAVSRYTLWISLKTAGLLLLVTSSTIAFAGYVGKSYEFVTVGIVLIALILILFCFAYVGRRLTASSKR